MEKTIVGLVEKVRLNSHRADEEISARIDTGATNSSIDLRLASRIKLGPVIQSKLVKSANGTRLRPVIECDIEICNKKIRAHFTLADRSHMKYPVLIGQNILKQGFLIDPLKNVESAKVKTK
ncbi:MAG: RimK/LysX family protein [Nanoarchaeota archaeon]|nr:RimK/LysX family protein [Nanoarchaeota archaeon]MBU1270017.1 RimK/LysX family protein [Nanoarchaeota archaeon]MBU1604553.1 RimK/LysX family protein [Nanoarchaeota archaeon]MBU2443621.1 RimK/LysX family protein [Nanoarchaeota archaeon]